MLFSLMTANAFAADAPALIPLPQKMEYREGAFKLQPKTPIRTDAAARATGNYLAERLGNAMGYSLKVATSTKPQPAKGAILLTTTDSKPELGPEGYELTVTADSVVVRAGKSAGLFYGVQTLFNCCRPRCLRRSQ